MAQTHKQTYGHGNSMTKKELRALEKIEESVLQKIFKTKLSCPCHLLYLEAGIMPARYQIHRQMLVFLQYILQQPKHSLMYKVYEAEKQSPTKGGWVSETSKLFTLYNIDMTFIEVQNMKTSLFKRLVRKKT